MPDRNKQQHPYTVTVIKRMMDHYLTDLSDWKQPEAGTHWSAQNNAGETSVQRMRWWRKENPTSLPLLVRRGITAGKTGVAYVRSSGNIAFCLKTDTDVWTLIKMLTNACRKKVLIRRSWNLWLKSLLPLIIEPKWYANFSETSESYRP